jgi:hypothetical protein
VPVYSCFDAYELMFMSKEFTDPDIIELAADTRVEHSVEVIVAIRTVQQSQLQFPCAQRTVFGGVIYLQDAKQLIASSSWCWLKTLIPCCRSKAVVTPLATIG